MHLEHISKVLQLLRYHLVAKEAKCLFRQQQINYLGHVLTPGGLAVDPVKIQIIQQWPSPRSVKDVRSFLGLSGYYRRFIRQYASFAGPLTDLLRKEPFCWTDRCQEAFDALKKALNTAPVLSLPNFTLEFHLKLMHRVLG